MAKRFQKKLKAVLIVEVLLFSQKKKRSRPEYMCGDPLPRETSGRGGSRVIDVGSSAPFVGRKRRFRVEVPRQPRDSLARGSLEQARAARAAPQAPRGSAMSRRGRRLQFPLASFDHGGRRPRRAAPRRVVCGAVRGEILFGGRGEVSESRVRR